MNEILSNESNEFNEIINNIKKKILNYESKFETKEVIKKWFVELNNEDVNILSIMATYLMLRISNLFMTNLDNLKQLKKNNNQDIKSIILLLLPYINDDKIDVYKKLKNLNELILTKKLLPSDYNLDRTNILNTHFIYTNIGIGLIDDNGNIELSDNKYGKLIYKIMYYNFISLNETLSIINGKLYVNWLNIYPLTENNYKESTIYKNTMDNIEIAANNLKQNKFTPGLHIPIKSRDYLQISHVDYIVILSWNFVDDIVKLLKSQIDNGTQIIVPFPKFKIL